MAKHEELTQKYSTYGDKLLRHTDLLHSIQHHGKFKPVTIQVALTEQCESDCAFCSVSERPLKSVIPYDKLIDALEVFKDLGAKSLEITGGGNPLLYSDGPYYRNGSGFMRTITDVISAAYELGYAIGIITNSHDFKAIANNIHHKIDWIRVSLIKLDEGREPQDYDFRGFPIEKIGFSYIIYGKTDETPRWKNYRSGTTKETIKRLAEMVDLYPAVKFVRIAGNCLIKGHNQAIKEHYRPIIDEIDRYGKFFVKDIGENDGAFPHGCYVGAIRPYIAPSPNGDGKYYVYACTSHVLNTRNYDLKYALCNLDDIAEAWMAMNERYRSHGYPYEISGNCGSNWDQTCKFCYYGPNNKLLHTVAKPMPDELFV